jgi:endonuclease YncB( thermonuclease family)
MGCIQSLSSNNDHTILTSPNHDNQHNHHAAIYNKLPSEYEKHEVIKVYDGDTLTLRDKRRVRFLGIDCPELKERQPFAQEAKDFTADKCGHGNTSSKSSSVGNGNGNKEIYFSFEPGSDKTDRYGRLLAWVWVGSKSGVGYININEALVSEGLASAYTPGSKKLQNKDKLIALQKKARESKLGKWKSFRDFNVYRTKYGKAFHRRDCKHLERSTHLDMIRVSKGLDQGLHPCRTCLPDL